MQGLETSWTIVVIVSLSTVLVGAILAVCWDNLAGLSSHLFRNANGTKVLSWTVGVAFVIGSSAAVAVTAGLSLPNRHETNVAPQPPALVQPADPAVAHDEHKHVRFVRSSSIGRSHAKCKKVLLVQDYYGPWHRLKKSKNAKYYNRQHKHWRWLCPQQ